MVILPPVVRPGPKHPTILLVFCFANDGMNHKSVTTCVAGGEFQESTLRSRPEHFVPISSYTIIPSRLLPTPSAIPAPRPSLQSFSDGQLIEEIKRRLQDIPTDELHEAANSHHHHAACVVHFQCLRSGATR